MGGLTEAIVSGAPRKTLIPKGFRRKRQEVERIFRNEEARGSNPLTSTSFQRLYQRLLRVCSEGVA